VLARKSRVLLAALALATNARADDIEAARRIFADGVKLYQKGDYEGARRLFKQADAEHHAAPIVYNLGLAEERLNHPQAAVDAYEKYVAETGDAGEYSSAAAVAIAQIKARSTKLRIESKPAGARVFVDGAPLAEPAPTTTLVPAGHHVVVAQGDGWREEKDVESAGSGDSVVVALAAPESPEPPPPPSPPPPPPPSATAPPPDRIPTPQVGEPDGLVWGASFAIVPAYLLGVTTAGASNASPGMSIIAGPWLDIGLALTERFEFMMRGMVGIGPDAKPSYAFMGGPGISFRVARPIWAGGAFIGGQFETRAHGVRYGTDQVFGALAEISVVVIEKPDGQWIASFMPSFLLTEQHVDNTTIFFPLSFGYRAF
jgi:hypothetical protein